MGAPLPQPWTGHRSVVPVEASFIEAVRRGAVVDFALVPAADSPRMRGQLVASQVGPEFYWNQFDAQGRNTGTREVRADEVDDLVHGLVAPELVNAVVLDSVSGIERVRLASSLAAKVAELQGATGMQRARIASELAALVALNSVSIYNSENGETAAKEPMMETTAPTMDRNETEARNLLAAGFKTKAAQQRAKEAATRAFNAPMRAILDVYLSGDRSEAGSEFYDSHPMYPHEWKPKHADMVRAALPDAAVHIEAVERIVRLAADIKGAPLLTTVADEKVARERKEAAIQAFNPALRAEFEAQAPALAAEFSTYMEKTYIRLQEVFPDGVPAYIDTRDKGYRHRDSVMMLRSVCDTITKPGNGGFGVHTLELNRAALELEAQRYGERTALQWFYKTNQKLGDLQNPTLVRDRDGYVHVKGERGGHGIELVQQRIINVSPLGRPFHQFPSRIYVDGKFVTEEAYAKMFAPA